MVFMLLLSFLLASFFSYDKSSTAQVSGVVFLKLAESRRRLAMGIDIESARVLQSAAGGQESGFAMEVQLEKNELWELLLNPTVLLVLSMQS